MKKAGNGIQYNESFIRKVQKGIIPGHSVISKFAENPSIQSATPADIWCYGPTEERYTFSTAAAIDSMSSSNNGDTVQILIKGLDTNWDESNLVYTLTGQGRVELTTPLIRVNEARNVNGTDLLGDVYIYENTAIVTGIPTDTTKVRAVVDQADQTTLMGIHSIPAGVTGYFLGSIASISRQPSAANCIFTGKARPFGGVFSTGLRVNMSTTGNSIADLTSLISDPFPGKTDFVPSSQVSANSIGVSTSLAILLVQDGF